MASAAERERGPCLVCGDKSTAFNFGVPTCMPCKAFFRRNAVKLGTYEFKCPKDGDCPITYTCRRICSCCRLAKCFRVGMKRSLILSDVEKEERRKIVERNRLKKGLPPKKKNPDWIRPSNLLVTASTQSKFLSSTDQAFLTNIFTAYERTCVATIKKEHAHVYSKPDLSLHTLFNEYSTRHVSLIEFFKQIPEFNRITINDKIRLIKNHFENMLSINESYIQTQERDTTLIRLKNLCGTELAMNLLRCIGLIQTYVHDPILLKLLLIVRSFSSSISRNRYDIDMNRVFEQPRCIFAAQNVYVELLWKYILSRVPTEQDAVKLLNKIILDLLFILRIGFMIDNFVYSCPDEVDQMEPLMKNMWPRGNM